MNFEDTTSIESLSGSVNWLCHICGTSSRGEGVACELCFRTTCPAHLQRRSIYNKASGLYEFTSICPDCQLSEFM